MKNKGGKTEGKVLFLLGEGHSLSAIAKYTKKSPAAILKRARRYVIIGKLERVAKGRYRKAIKPELYPPLKPVGDFTPLPIMLPHKFGAIFAQVGKPNLPYTNRGKAEERTPLYLAQFGKNNGKAQIWLYGGFQGSGIDEIVASGKEALIAIAASLEQKHSITLTLLRFYSDIEWVDVSKQRSKATAKGIGIGRGEQVVVDGAIHKLDPISHKDHLEFNKLPQGDPTRPTDHARIHHSIYSGEYERRFDILMEGNERFSANLEKHLAVLEEMSAALKAIKKSIEEKP